MILPAEGSQRRVGTIWVFGLDQPAPPAAPRVKTAFRRAGAELAPSLAAAGGGLSAAEVARRFQAGSRCYAAWVKRRLAAYGWVSFSSEYIGELQLHIHLEPCEAYIWDCYTVPRFRQKHLYTALLGFILNALRSEAVCRVWIGADLDNAPSQAGIERAGFQRVADLVADPAAPRRYWTQGYPGIAESLVAEARRVYLGETKPLPA